MLPPDFKPYCTVCAALVAPPLKKLGEKGADEVRYCDAREAGSRIGCCWDCMQKAKT
jgi:hypothetical protein